MKTWVWIAIGAGAAAVVVTGVGIAEYCAHASTGPCSVPAQFYAGHRYRVVLKAPPGQSIPPLPANAVAQFQSALDQQYPGAAKVVSIDPLPPSSVTIIVDVLPGVSASVLGNPQDMCAAFSQAPAGSTVVVQDMGPTPAGG